MVPHPEYTLVASRPSPHGHTGGADLHGTHEARCLLRHLEVDARSTSRELATSTLHHRYLQTTLPFRPPRTPSRRYILAPGLLNVPSYKAPAICITPAWDRPIRALDSKWQITSGTPAHSPTNRSALILNEDYFSPADPNSNEDFWHIKLILSPLAHLLRPCSLRTSLSLLP
jgi:hypothetical protein